MKLLFTLPIECRPDQTLTVSANPQVGGLVQILPDGRVMGDPS